MQVKQLDPGNPVFGEGSCSTPSSGFYSEIAGGGGATDRYGGGGTDRYGGVKQRESDSLYHSAESVRLKKQRAEDGGGPSVNIIENVMVGGNRFIR